MSLDIKIIQQFYLELPGLLTVLRRKIGRPLSLTDKILFSHLSNRLESLPVEHDAGLEFTPDRVAFRDANAQLALLQFAASGRIRTLVPASVHCDHLVIAETGAKEDLARAYLENKEIFDFLESFCAKYGLGFWKPGSGVINQVFLENYAFPGGMMLGSDAYTSHAGGLGMLAIGAGASEAVGVMVGMPFEMRLPRKIAVHLSGKLQDWVAPKDVALKLWELLAPKGAANAIIEFMGEGAETLTCSGKSTICNMGAEVGAIASLFSYDTSMAEYLIATGRKEVAELANSVLECLRMDPIILTSPKEHFDEYVEIDLSELEPRISGPQGIEKSWPLSEFAAIIRQGGFSEKLSVAAIGSCVNSSFEDMGKAASIARQAWKHGLNAKSALLITPGSEKMRATLERDGHLKALEEIGCTQLASSCGPCAGLWKRHDVTFGEKNCILTSFNRSFSGRHDGNPGTQAFVASPEIAVALALAGRLTFNPMIDALITAQGLPLRFSVPRGDGLPQDGFVLQNTGYIPPTEEGLDAQLIIDPDSKRLQLLKPFEPWNGKDCTDMRLLVKAAGKAAAEQISPGGRWLKLRGHLDNISDNFGLTLANAFREEIGKGKNLLTGGVEPFAKIAKDYKKEEVSWIVVAEENYGEGSACELIAMIPRHLGCKAVIAKSFANPAEILLKRQGILALTFTNWEDYGKIREDDFLDLLEIKELALGSRLELLLKHSDGTTHRITLQHSYTPTQIQWFKAGSAFNRPLA